MDIHDAPDSIVVVHKDRLKNPKRYSIPYKTKETVAYAITHYNLHSADYEVDLEATRVLKMEQLLNGT